MATQEVEAAARATLACAAAPAAAHCHGVMAVGPLAGAPCAAVEVGGSGPLPAAVTILAAVAAVAVIRLEREAAGGWASPCVCGAAAVAVIRLPAHFYWWAEAEHLWGAAAREWHYW